MLLLGAGASQDANIPVAEEMTRRIVDMANQGAVRPRGLQADARRVINFAVGQILAHDSADGYDPRVLPGVERLYSAIELLANRSDLQVTPFVSEWHPAVDAMSRTEWPALFDSNFRKAIFKNGREISQLLRPLISDKSDQPRRDAPFENTMRYMLRCLMAVTHIDSPEEVAYLRPILALLKEQGQLRIATLNYDRAIEILAEDNGVVCDTSIVRWSETRRWKWPETGIGLMKLHGSTDWYWDTSRVNGLMPQSIVRQGTNPAMPAVIFGEREKLRPAGPFLSLLSEFAQSLSEVTELIVIGYSFRDDHINVLISDWLNTRPDSTITVVDPYFTAEPRLLSQPVSYAAQLFTTLHGDEEKGISSRIAVVRGSAKEELPALFSSD
jgi:SIR2-like domain